MCLFIIFPRRRKSPDENRDIPKNRRWFFRWFDWNQRSSIANAIISVSAVDRSPLPPDLDGDSDLPFILFIET